MDERYEGMDYQDVVSYADKMIAMLRKLQWCSCQNEGGACPICGNLFEQKGKHRSDCELKELIGD